MAIYVHVVFLIFRLALPSHPRIHTQHRTPHILSVVLVLLSTAPNSCVSYCLLSFVLLLLLLF
jgi:hypothetical protein